MTEHGFAGAPVVICRCEEITEQDVIRAWEAGYRTPEEIKRLLRLGMGPCQGRTCTPLVVALIARLADRPVAEVAPPQWRPPLKATPLEMFSRLDLGEGVSSGDHGTGGTSL